MIRILIIGGSGVFGLRLAEGLLRLGGIEVVLAGRRRARLETAARALRAKAQETAVTTLVLDTRRIAAADLKASGAHLVIDAAGPFQGARPTVAEAAIEAGIHYADLADARDFVADFPSLDVAARRAGVVALTGVSSTPALSNAVLDHLTRGWARIDRIRVGIAPGNRAPRGASVVRAILSWTGAPVRVFEDGGWRTRPGWSGTAKVAIGDLGPRRLALAETPDLDLLVARFRPTREARFEAGLELGLLHNGLALAGWLRRHWLLPDPAIFAELARRTAGLLLGFGTDRGGMIVEATGRDQNDVPTLARWTLVAEAGDGPYIPTLPAVALVERFKEGRPPRPGARAAAGDIALRDILRAMKPHRIRTSLTTSRLASVFERALGPGFASLPEPIRRAHDSGPATVLAGEAAIEGAGTLAGQFAARALGLPPARPSAETEVRMDVFADGREIWRRRFGRHRFATTLATSCRGSYAETRGPLAVDCSIATGPRGVVIAVTGLRLGGWLLPRTLAPRCEGRETVDSRGRFRFDVALSLPPFGRLVRYHGWLQPADPRRRGRERPIDGLPDEIALPGASR